MENDTEIAVFPSSVMTVKTPTHTTRPKQKIKGMKGDSMSYLNETGVRYL